MALKKNYFWIRKAFSGKANNQVLGEQMEMCIPYQRRTGHSLMSFEEMPVFDVRNGDTASYQIRMTADKFGAGKRKW